MDPHDRKQMTGKVVAGVFSSETKEAFMLFWAMGGKKSSRNRVRKTKMSSRHKETRKRRSTGKKEDDEGK
ncbi:hypothetical protein O6P43_017824 [Quillaja saponaria]|uniref:Uncharacterized protein n=1 Tax=Quillaja saponaria TaxID=32244 RepID=A0AAD7PP06_QUISA|nr:hypothetical protein O6P43_017824 [Quillaja saponaria]